MICKCTKSWRCLERLLWKRAKAKIKAMPMLIPMIMPLRNPIFESVVINLCFVFNLLLHFKFRHELYGYSVVVVLDFKVLWRLIYTLIIDEVIHIYRK